MKETLITFETAKLAKEKGFNIKLKKRFRLENGVAVKKKYGKKQDFNTNNPNHEVYSRPTQSLLQKWLREEYNCYIDILPHRDGDSKNEKWKTKEDVFWLVEVDYYGKNFEIEYTEGSDFSQTFIKTYEEALEIGLQEGLKLI